MKLNFDKYKIQSFDYFELKKNSIKKVAVHYYAL
jgi:hypothetical protein